MALFDFSLLNSFGPIVPFLFMLAVVYGALEYAKVFKNRAVNAIISVAIAFMAMINTQVVSFIQAVIPYAAILFIIFFFIAIVTKPLRKAGSGGSTNYEFLIIIIVLILLFLVQMGGSGSPLSGMFNFGFLGSEDLLWGIGLVAILLIFWFAYKHSGKQ